MAAKPRPKKAAAKKKAPKKAAAKKSAAKKSSAKKPSVKSAAKKAASKAKSRARKAATKATTRAKKAANSARSEGTQRGSKLAISVIDLQKTTFDNTVKALESLQKQTEKVLKELIDSSSIVPGEGKKIVDEWRRMLKRSQQDLTKTVDKSFDLFSAFFERVRREELAKAKSKKPAKAAPKKTKVKRKPKKAAAKKAAAKKVAAAGDAS